MKNYFDIFDLPISFEIDKAYLTKKYYALSKLFHPDKFTLASGEEQEEALNKSTSVNEGYKLLGKKQSRIRHILELLGAAPEEGKESMPQEFLMEMMDVNEAIMDYKMEPTPAALTQVKKQIAEFQSDTEQAYQSVIKDFDFEQPNADILATLKSIYLKNKYLKRLLDNLEDRGVEL